MTISTVDTSISQTQNLWSGWNVHCLYSSPKCRDFHILYNPPFPFFLLHFSITLLFFSSPPFLLPCFLSYLSPPPPPPLHSPLSPLPVPQEYRHWVNLTFTARCRAVLLSAVVRLMSKEPASLLISRASRQSNLCLSGVRLTIACTAASPF